MTKSTGIEIMDKITVGVKSIQINGYNIYFWYANNKGRGRSNCTISIVTGGVPRASLSRMQHGELYTNRIVAWRGTPIINKKILAELIAVVG